MAEKFFCIGLLTAFGIVLVIGFLVSLAKGAQEELDQKFQGVWDAVLRTSGTGSMLAGKISDLDARVKALEAGK